jgi:hypothetical protein
MGYGGDFENAEESKRHGQKPWRHGKMHLLRSANRDGQNLATDKGGRSGRSDAPDGFSEIRLPTGLSD